MNGEPNSTLSEGPLLNERGALSETGYSFSPVKSYDASLLPFPKREKRWDFAYAINEKACLSLSYADLGFSKRCSVQLILFEEGGSKAYRAEGRMGGDCLFSMPRSPLSGGMDFSERRAASSKPLSFSKKKADKATTGRSFMSASMKLFPSGKRELVGFCPDFGEVGKDLHFDVVLEKSVKEIYDFTSPLEKEGAFLYAHRELSLSAAGYAKWGDDFHSFLGGYGGYQWNAGVFPKKVECYWSSANGSSAGLPLSWNIGYFSSSLAKSVANVVFFAGKPYKIGEVRMDIPVTPSGKDDFLAPWRFRSPGGEVIATFDPACELESRSHDLLHKLASHRVYGTFSGTLLLDGRPISFQGIPGFCGKADAHW